MGKPKGRMELSEKRHRRQSREGSGEEAGTRPSFKWAGAHESTWAATEFQMSGSSRVKAFEMFRSDPDFLIKMRKISSGFKPRSFAGWSSAPVEQGRQDPQTVEGSLREIDVDGCRSGTACQGNCHWCKK